MAFAAVAAGLLGNGNFNRLSSVATKLGADLEKDGDFSVATNSASLGSGSASERSTTLSLKKTVT